MSFNLFKGKGKYKMNDQVIYKYLNLLFPDVIWIRDDNLKILGFLNNEHFITIDTNYIKTYHCIYYRYKIAETWYVKNEKICLTTLIKNVELMIDMRNSNIYHYSKYTHAEN